jgi:hypothetical protein
MTLAYFVFIPGLVKIAMEQKYNDFDNYFYEIEKEWAKINLLSIVYWAPILFSRINT